MADITEIASRFEKAKTAREHYEDSFQELQDLALPFIGDYRTKRHPSDKRVMGVFDSTAAEAIDSFASWLKGQIYPSHFDWLQFEPSEGEAGESQEAKDELARAQYEFLKHLAKSNYYLQSTESWKLFSLIGNSCLYPTERPPFLKPDGSTFMGLLYTSIPMTDVWWFANSDGPYMIFRMMTMFAIDALRRYPDLARNSAFKRAYEADIMNEVKILHCAYLNENDIPGGMKSETNKLWVSEKFYYDGDPRGAVRAEPTMGFDYQPYICARDQVVGSEIYGRGRGHMCRSNMLGINESMRKLLNAAGRDMDPSLMLWNGMQLQETQSGRYITVTSTIPGVSQSPSYLPSGAKYEAAILAINSDREQIKRAFMNHLIEEPDSQTRSAEAERSRLRRIGAKTSGVVEIVSNVLSMSVQSSLNILSSGGQMKSLQRYQQITGENSFEYRYVSPFFTSQKEHIAEKIFNHLGRIANLSIALQDPAIKDFVDMDKAVSAYLRYSDVVQDIFRSQADVTSIRTARAEQKAEQEFMQMMSAAQGGPSAPRPPGSGGSIKDFVGVDAQ